MSRRQLCRLGELRVRFCQQVADLGSIEARCLRKEKTTVVTIHVENRQWTRIDANQQRNLCLQVLSTVSCVLPPLHPRRLATCETAGSAACATVSGATPVFVAQTALSAVSPTASRRGGAWRDGGGVSA